MNIPRKPRSRTDLRLVIAAPLARIDESGPVHAALALGGAVLGAVFSPVFSGIVALLLLAHICDWILGSVTAWRLGAFDGEAARRGAISKLSGLVAICLLRAFEVWVSIATNLQVLDSPAPLSIGAAVWLFAVELGSIARHNRDLGWVVARFRRLYGPPGFTNQYEREEFSATRSDPDDLPR